MKFRISQTFETLGDNCEKTVATREAAEAWAETLRVTIAEMVAGWETPAEYAGPGTGWAKEVAAWEKAEDIAGVTYDEEGMREKGSAETYGEAAGAYIAEKAVEIEEIED